MRIGKMLTVSALVICLVMSLCTFTVLADSPSDTGVKFQRLILNDALTMRFDVAVDSADVDATTVNVKLNGAKVIADQAVAQLPAGEEGCYQVNVDMSAAQLADVITIEVVTDGKVVSTEQYRAVDYAKVILGGDYSAATKNLVTAMLQYGGTSQAYFGYNTEDLANAGLRVEDVVLPQWTQTSIVNGSIPGVQFYGVTLVVRSRVAVRFYFQAEDLSGLDFGGYTPTPKDGMYYVEIPGINAQDYANNISLTVSNGTQEMTVSYSPMAYILRKHASTSNAQLKALTAAMYQYHTAAKAYIAENGDVVTDDNGIVIESVVIRSGASSAVVSAGTQLEENVTSLTLSATPLTQSGSDVIAGEKDQLISMDVHIAGISPDNTVPVLVTLDQLAPEFLNQGNIRLFHVEDGNTNEMTRVYAMNELDAHNEYYYDVATGTVTVAMASFSEISALASENHWNGNTDTSWYTGDKKVYEIFNADQLAGFGKLVDEGNNFAGTTVKMLADIDLYGTQIVTEEGEEVEIRRSFNPIGFGYAYSGGQVFSGIFDGNGHTISNLYQNGWDLGYSYGTQGGGLFASIVNATIKNLTMDNAYIVMECVDMGTVVGYANGNCNFENIIVRNSTIQNYNRYTGGVIGEVGGGGKYTLTNVDVEETTTISALWGTFDPACGGIIGGVWHTAGTNHGTNNELSVIMTNCDVACTLDVYNDVTSAYQWYSYRRCGMLIGYTEQSEIINGRTEAIADFLTTENCTVSYGDWVNYHYCEFNNTTSMEARYPWVRVEAGLSNSAYSNPRYGHPIVNGEAITAETHTEADHLPGDQHDMVATFHQLYGGGQGCYGGNSHVGNGVTEINAPEAIQKFVPVVDQGHKIKTGTTITLGSLFAAAENIPEAQAIQGLDVIAFVSPVSEQDTVRATFNKHGSKWDLSSLTFTGRGNAIITIQDYYYCQTTTLYVTVPESGEYIIVGHQILGDWVLDREGDSKIGPHLTYDLNINAAWNPEATNDKENGHYYVAGEGILYVLEKPYDLTQIQLDFDIRENYFDLYVSADGVNYNSVASVTVGNVDTYFDNLVATFNGNYSNVKYIKILFTGGARDEEGNPSVYVSLSEVSVSGTVSDVKKDEQAVNASIDGHTVLGTWYQSFDGSPTAGPQFAYDGSTGTRWNPQVTNFKSGEGIIYELDGAYDLREIKLFFGSRPHYFDIYVSADGENYMPLAVVNVDNYDRFYTDGFVCNLEGLANQDIQYIKVVFTGTSTNTTYIILNEIQISGVKVTEITE